MSNIKRRRGGLASATPFPGPGRPQSLNWTRKYNSEIVIPPPTIRVPPTRRSLVETPWHTTTATKTMATSWQNGDRILVFGATAATGETIATPTITGLSGTGFTFGALGSAQNYANACWMHTWEGLATGTGSGNISTTRTGADVWGAAASVWYNCSGFAVRSFPAPDALEAVSVAVANARANVQVLLADFAAAGDVLPPDAQWTPAGIEEIEKSLSNGLWAVYYGEWADQAVGTRSYGIDVPASGPFTKRAIEIFGADIPDPGGFEGWGMPIA